MTTSMESINGKANDLQNEFDNAEKRKSTWNSTTKPLITQIMNSFTRSTNTLKATIGKGVEFVSLTLDPQKVANYPGQLRTSGSLFYSLSHRGKVYAIIIFPFVEGQVEKLPA